MSSGDAGIETADVPRGTLQLPARQDGRCESKIRESRLRPAGGGRPKASTAIVPRGTIATQQLLAAHGSLLTRLFHVEHRNLSFMSIDAASRGFGSGACTRGRRQNDAEVSLRPVRRRRNACQQRIRRDFRCLRRSTVAPRLRPRMFHVEHRTFTFMRMEAASIGVRESRLRAEVSGRRCRNRP